MKECAVPRNQTCELPKRLAGGTTNSALSGENLSTIKFLNFWDAKIFCCNLPKIQIKRPNFKVFHQKDANLIANSEDPDQTAPLGAV